MSEHGRLRIATMTLALLCGVSVTAGKEKDPADKPMSAGTFAGLKLRSLGPALMSGRICDFAVNPNHTSQRYAAMCSGGVWKTENGGTTWKPIFDKQGSYSVGCVTLDPNNANVVWVGTGENNSQRSVSFGNGVYRSRDGGKNWENMGLRQSEHIGMIVVDPRDSNTVYVAAQGPLWRAGGDRGLYKTTDGGKTWKRVLDISNDTGVNEVHFDPRNPDVLYASSYQRRRRVWTLINGGPESAIYKSEDAGATWRELKKGIPAVDKGRIGLCVSPGNPDVVYAIVEAQGDKGGFFRSTDRGETWTRRNKYMASSPQYYNEIVCDPIKVDRVYTLDTFMRVTEDGGKTFHRTPRQFRHVDDHALWIDPSDTRHLLVGCDGGVYESYDRGEAWQYKPNLPITQFYRVAVDNAEPFYNIYGGTQDNNTLGGPSRTTNPAGIFNEDWFVTVGGDGFETQVDPTDPMIVYSQWQYGGLIRHDRRSGQIVDIKPREAPGEEPYRWNWDSPLIISSHDHKRLYFGANVLFRSDDRGNSWRKVSGDLSRGLDRDALKVMGKVQRVDAVAKNRSTSIYGNTVALAESPRKEDVLYVGTDDGLIHVTEDGGQNWRVESLFPGVPDRAYVSFLVASQHDAGTVYATFDNHKDGDFKPYILRSTDHGHTWKSITGDLPDREIVYTLGEDHVKPDLLFAGTEFGVYFTIDGGEKWIKLKGGMPTIAVKDLTIQKRESDLVLATFGRGFYVLDDYTPLRVADETFFKQDAAIFPVKPALRYIETSRLGGWSGRGSQGAMFFVTPNPAFGATFTYYLKDKLLTKKEKRKKAEKDGSKDYPSIDELREEDQQLPSSVMLTVRDDTGAVVQRVKGSREKGIHRVAWNLRYPSSRPTQLKRPKNLPPWAWLPRGPLALPGTYTVTMEKQVDGVVTAMTEPVSFEVVPLELATFPAKDREVVMAFQKKAARLSRAVQGAGRAIGEVDTRLSYLRKALVDTPAADPAILGELYAIRTKLNAIKTTLQGDRTLAKHMRPAPTSISERVGAIVSDQWDVTSAPTQTQLDGYQYAADEFVKVLAELHELIEKDLAAVEAKMEAAGAPWTPGRLPVWERE